MASSRVIEGNVADIYNHFHRHDILTDATLHEQTPVTGIIATGGSDFSKVDGFTRVSIGVVNGAANSVVWTPEGSFDGINWFPLAWKVNTATAFANGARTSIAAASEAVFLDTDQYVRFVRVNIGTANANGTVFRVSGQS